METYRSVRTEDDYNWALREVDPYFAKPPKCGSAAGNRFEILLDLIEHYEATYYTIDRPDPIEAIKTRMNDKDLSQRQLAHAADVSESRMSEYLNRKRPMTLDAIRSLSALLDLPIAVLAQPSVEHAST